MTASYDSNKTEAMRATAESFLRAFIAGSPPSMTLDQYFTSDATILEHGPTWATERLPFLGTTFQGRSSQKFTNAELKNTCDDYYALLTSVLSFHPNDDTMPPKADFIVDPDRGTVVIKLHAKFTSIRTGKSWDEDFIYVLSNFDENYKIGSQELWADPLSAWMAVGD